MRIRIVVNSRFRICFVGANVLIDDSSAIFMHNLSRIDSFTRIIGYDYMNVTMMKRSSIGSFSTVHLGNTLTKNKSSLFIGRDTHISSYSSIGCAGSVFIGDKCIFGEGLFLHSENHNFDLVDVPIMDQGVNQVGIRIESNCWFGSRVTVLDGVTVGSGCVVGAGSVITKSFPPRSVIAGVPARLIKSR